MIVKLLIFTLIFACAYANLEIHIEGKNGWAKNRPTWRKDYNFLKYLIGANKPLTGYHLWMTILIVAIYHMLFLFISWNVVVQLQILAFIIFFFVFEDFLWFVFNPYYGLKRFREGEIRWHKEWIGKIPQSYVLNISIGIFFLLLSKSV